MEEYISTAIQLYGVSDKRNRKPIYGFGINDAEYVTQSPSRNWCCIHNKTWQGVLRRSLSLKFKNWKQSYLECKVSESWKYFTDYLEWSIENYVEGWELDKDILIPQNKLYGPETCAFVPSYLNALIKPKVSKSGLPLGVNKVTNSNRYTVCSSRDGDYLGKFKSPEEAHSAWQWDKASKIERAIARFAREPVGFRTDVAEALTKRVWDLRLAHTLKLETKEL